MTKHSIGGVSVDLDGNRAVRNDPMHDRLLQSDDEHNLGKSSIIIREDNTYKTAYEHGNAALLFSLSFQIYIFSVKKKGQLKPQNIILFSFSSSWKVYNIHY